MSRAFTIPSIFTAVDRFSAPVRGMTAATSAFAGRADVALARVERGFRRLISPINDTRRLLSNAGLYIGLFTLITVLQGAIRVMADFDQAQVNLASVMDKKSLPMTMQLSDQARSMAVQYGIAATKVSELQYELVKMGFGAGDVLNMTPAITTGAVAMRAEADKLAQVVGAVFKTFPEMKPSDTQKVVDQMAKIIDITALDATTLFEMMPRAMKAAADIGVPFERLLAMFGALKDSMIPVASASTAVKNIFIDSTVKGKKYTDMLEQMISTGSALNASFKMFGRKSGQSAMVLGSAQHSGLLEKNEQIIKNSLGYSAQLAAKQLESFWGTLRKTKSAYQEFLLSIDDGTGKYSAMFKEVDRVVAAMFLLASGTSAAKLELKTMKVATIEVAKRWMGYLNMIKNVIIALIGAKVAMVAWRLATIAATIAGFAFNVVLGLMAAFAGAEATSVGLAAGSKWAYIIATRAATAVAWQFNAALVANPIGLVIALVAALTAAILVAVEYWQKWGAAVTLVATLIGGPLFLVIGGVLMLIQSFRRNWDKIMDAFKIGGFISGLKMIGATILDAVLMPLQQLLELIHRITGFDWAKSAAEGVAKFRQKMGAETQLDESGKRLQRAVTPFAERKINDRSLWKMNDQAFYDFQRKVEKLEKRFHLDNYPAEADMTKRDVVDNRATSNSEFSETLNRTVQQIELTVKARPDMDIQTTKNPARIPLRYKSTMGEFE